MARPEISVDRPVVTAGINGVPSSSAPIGPYAPVNRLVRFVPPLTSSEVSNSPDSRFPSERSPTSPAEIDNPSSRTSAVTLASANASIDTAGTSFSTVTVIRPVKFVLVVSPSKSVTPT